MQFGRGIASLLFCKALILREHGNKKLAAEILRELLCRYADSDDPALSFVSETVPDLLADLANDPESG